MNKMLVAVFQEESAAYKGLDALRDLHRNGDITLYASAVVAKDAAGNVSVKELPQDSPLATPIGLLTGSLVGFLAGPVGLAVGAGLGSLAGLTIDLSESEIDIGFLNEVASAMSPGKVAVLAEVQESWVTPVDTSLGKLGGWVFRRLRSEVVEDQLSREAAELHAELKQLKNDLVLSRAESRAAVQKKIDRVTNKLEAIRAVAGMRAGQAKLELWAKISTLYDQFAEVDDHEKAKIEKRIVEVGEEYSPRRTKLDQAQAVVEEEPVVVDEMV